jgi:hypothetical protein
MENIMPKELEKKLKREAEKKHMNKERENKYVFGTMSKLGLLKKKPKKK